MTPSTFETVFNTLKVPVVVVNAGGTFPGFVAGNAAFYELTELTLSEIRGSEDWPSLIAASECPSGRGLSDFSVMALRTFMNAAVAEKDAIKQRIALSAAFDGIHFVVMNDEEQPAGKNSSEQTVAVERQLKMFFNNSIFGAFFMTADRPLPWHEETDRDAALDYLLTHLRITRVNQAMLDQYGASRAEFMGRTPHDFFRHDPEQEKVLLCDIFDKGNHRAVSFERNEAGEVVIFEGDYEVLRNEDNDIVGIFGLQQDITKRFRYIEEIESQNERLRDIARFQSHTVRSPLSRMLSILEVYESDAFTHEERSEFLGYLKSAAKELDGIIAQIVERTDRMGEAAIPKNGV